MDKEGTDGVFTFTVKNNSDAPLRMTPNEIFTVKVLDAEGKTKWSNYFNLSIEDIFDDSDDCPDAASPR